ncbi:MAG TPA: hypothetical protein RMI62_00240, partial [Polyangiaceae bacterium LLY-WYZ-15_(1-7)]|nr:hypothetical protein [Polyangiaceae bacterium LLY-WYZ-15_(1-7)]
ALCGDDASDADGDGVTWTAGEGDCSDLNPADVAGGCAPDVDDPCAAHADCGSCNEAIGCGWCGATGTCASDGRRGACGGDWRGSPSSCVDCSGHATCDSCVDDGFCGWCPGVGCLNDHTEAAVACGEAYSVLACM